MTQISRRATAVTYFSLAAIAGWIAYANPSTTPIVAVAIMSVFVMLLVAERLGYVEPREAADR